MNKLTFHIDKGIKTWLYYIILYINVEKYEYIFILGINSSSKVILWLWLSACCRFIILPANHNTPLRLSVPLWNQCSSPYSSLSLSLSFSLANQRAGKVVDPAGWWFLWEGPRPCERDSEMGRLGGQTLPWLFPPHGQVPFLPGESARPVHWLQQSGERAGRVGVLMWPARLECGWTVFLLKESLTMLMYESKVISDHRNISFGVSE